MLMILQMMLDVDVFAGDAGFWWFGACCWILMISRIVLNFDDFEEDAGF